MLSAYYESMQNELLSLCNAHENPAREVHLLPLSERKIQDLEKVQITQLGDKTLDPGVTSKCSYLTLTTT